MPEVIAVTSILSSLRLTCWRSNVAGIVSIAIVWAPGTPLASILCAANLVLISKIRLLGLKVCSTNTISFALNKPLKI